MVWSIKNVLVSFDARESCDPNNNSSTKGNPGISSPTPIQVQLEHRKSFSRAKHRSRLFEESKFESKESECAEGRAGGLSKHYFTIADWIARLNSDAKSSMGKLRRDNLSEWMSRNSTTVAGHVAFSRRFDEECKRNFAHVHTSRGTLEVCLKYIIFFFKFLFCLFFKIISCR